MNRNYKKRCYFSSDSLCLSDSGMSSSDTACNTLPKQQTKKKYFIIYFYQSLKKQKTIKTRMGNRQSRWYIHQNGDFSSSDKSQWWSLDGILIYKSMGYIFNTYWGVTAWCRLACRRLYSVLQRTRRLFLRNWLLRPPSWNISTRHHRQTYTTTNINAEFKLIIDIIRTS